MNATAVDNSTLKWQRFWKFNKIFIFFTETLAVANFSTNATTDIYVNQTLRLCGFGSVANYYTRPTKMKCTDLFIQPSVSCGTLANTICSFWTDRDNNACNNDYGGALYAYSYNGSKINQTVVGMASFAPDYRPSAPCYDGHKVVHVQTASYIPWALNIINVSFFETFFNNFKISFLLFYTACSSSSRTTSSTLSFILYNFKF